VWVSVHRLGDRDGQPVGFERVQASRRQGALLTIWRASRRRSCIGSPQFLADAFVHVVATSLSRLASSTAPGIIDSLH